jgi:hypothetical protein
MDPITHLAGRNSDQKTELEHAVERLEAAYVEYNAAADEPWSEKSEELIALEKAVISAPVRTLRDAIARTRAILLFCEAEELRDETVHSALRALLSDLRGLDGQED